MTIATTATTAAGSAAAPPERVARLSYFFPAHNEEANLEGLVEEALETLPTLAETFEIIAVDDGSKDATPALADALAARHPGVVRVVHHPVNLGYGAALRSGLRGRPLRPRRLHRRRPAVPRRRHRPADRADGGRGRPGRGRRVPHQARGPVHPHGIRPGLPAGQPDLLRTPGDRRRLRVQAHPARGTGRPAGRVGWGVLLRRAPDQAPGVRSHRRRGGRAALPAHRRLAHRRQAPGDHPGGP